MAERLHPGVYVEEQPRGLAPIQGVSTSNYGTVGFTPKGPVDEAVLVTGFEQAVDRFGTFTEKGQAMTHLFAFFANGGRRAYLVRVVASDAVVADGFITSDYSDEVLATGDGTEKDYTSGGAGPLTLAHTEIEPSSVTISYRTDGTPVAGAAVTPNVAPDGSQLDFTFYIQVAGNAPIVAGTVIINTTATALPVLYKDGDNAGGFAPTPADEGQGRLYDDGGNLRGYVDYETGLVTLSVESSADEPDAASSITADYTPADTVVTLSDDGSGGIPAGAVLASAGTIDYVTGDVEFTIDAAADPPSNGQPILVSYTQRVWDIDPISAGVWGNGLEVQLRGNDNYFDRETATYSKFDLLVSLDGEVEEVFSEVDMDTSTDAEYVGSVVNDEDQGSDLITLVEPSNEDVAPFTLNGVQHTFVVGGGDGANLDYGTYDGSVTGTPTIPPAFRSDTISPATIQQGSVSIVYTDVNGTVRTITDDGAGNLIGDVDGAAPSGFNVIDYTTGDFAFRVPAGQEPSQAETSHLAAPTGNQAGSQITATYYTQPAAALTTDALSGGSDGVASIGRNELTDPTLKADKRGMYALLTADELMNIGIPDAAGDVTMAVDQVAEAETNGKWFIILATTPGLTPQGAVDYRRNTLGISSSYAALYYPYIRITDPVTDRGLNVPPVGHIAGVYARTDSTKSVGKAPAGTVDGRLNFSIGLERKLTFDEVDILHPAQVNAIMDTPQTGRAVWGARTLENPPGDFRFIHVRRLFNFLKSSIFNSTHGFVFENVGAALRSRIQLAVEDFLSGLFQQGVFAGTTPAQAYKVVCDETNNDEATERAGIVYCDVYVAPNTPGEFIVFRLRQKFTST